jgi:hypothetical protein
MISISILQYVDLPLEKANYKCIVDRLRAVALCPPCTRCSLPHKARLQWFEADSTTSIVVELVSIQEEKLLKLNSGAKFYLMGSKLHVYVY